MDKRNLSYNSLITQSVEELEDLLKNKSQSVRSRERIQFLYFLKTGTCSSQSAAGSQIGLGARASQNLWKRYRTNAFKSYLNPYQGGNRTLLTAAQDVALLERLKKDDMITQTNVKEYLLETFGVEYDLSSISKKLKRLGVKNKTGRPVNIRKDSEGEVEFKKNFKN